MLSLVMCSTYVACDLGNWVDHENLNLIGAFAALLLWIKMFYWMRLFRSFSSFIRIITEIVSDIKIFGMMLLLCLSGFANIVMILNLNRIHSGNEPII